MLNINDETELNKRRTFAIISHPDAGKTTITEKMLFLGNAIHMPGVIKGRGNKKFAKSDWMRIEKARGISVTTSVMQFTYKNILINLLDTPGHEDFSEDTYRILTAVDCCLVIIDAAKGIEERTRKLISITRLNKTPIITFINKLDRDSLDAIELLDQIEKELQLPCLPITWPIGCGKNFKGVYHIYDKKVYFYVTMSHQKNYVLPVQNFSRLSDILLEKKIDLNMSLQICEELKLICQIYPEFNRNSFLQGSLTPVFFGSALKNFGINHVLTSLIKWAPTPLYRQSNIRKIYPQEKFFTGFIFKIQANMDLKHRDRIAFMRIVSGHYEKGIKLRHVRIKKNIVVSDAFSFLAGDRFFIEKAYPGDVIGLHNHGTIKIGDTFTQGEEIKFLGMPIFVPEIFRSIILRNPLQKKQLKKGLTQLSEEGAVQVFYPLNNNDILLGAIGILQFDVVIERLQIEYKIDAMYKKVNIVLARWISSKNADNINLFINQHSSYIALDSASHFIYLAPSIINLNIMIEKYPEIIFDQTIENL